MYTITASNYAVSMVSAIAPELKGLLNAYELQHTLDTIDLLREEGNSTPEIREFILSVQDNAECDLYGIDLDDYLDHINR